MATIENYRVFILAAITGSLMIVCVNVFWLQIFCGVTISVANHGREEITTLVFTIRGDRKEVKKVMPGKSETVTLHPTTDTDVGLTFVDSKGRAHEKHGAYLERHLGGGTISVTIDADANVSWVDSSMGCLF